MALGWAQREYCHLFRSCCSIAAHRSVVCDYMSTALPLSEQEGSWHSWSMWKFHAQNLSFLVTHADFREYIRTRTAGDDKRKWTAKLNTNLFSSALQPLHTCSEEKKLKNSCCDCCEFNFLVFFLLSTAQWSLTSEYIDFEWLWLLNFRFSVFVSNQNLHLCTHGTIDDQLKNVVRSCCFHVKYGCARI